MDANGTRFHLLQGENDWSRCHTVGGVGVFEIGSPSPRQVQWDAPRNEVTLWKQEFRFPGAKSDRPVSLEDRRGAARDRFGNWYWIGPERESILVLSSGSQAVSTYWPPEPSGEPDDHDAGDFRPQPASVPTRPTLQGLTVTDDHYLVAGTIAPPGLIAFDLYSGGPPRQRLWSATFEPFDLSAREGGGVFILDRTHGRVWEIDRRFEVVTTETGLAPAPDDGGFTSIGGRDVVESIARPPIGLEEGWPVMARDPVAVAALPGEGVLVLDRDDGTGFARVHWLARGVARGAPASTRVLLPHLERKPGEPAFTLVAHDFALGARAADDPSAWLGRLYIVGTDGNQAHAFDVLADAGQLVLHPLTEFFPMRLFGGRALVTAAGEPWYDSGDRWLRLMAQDRPRYVERGELWTPVFDSGEPGCVWHRLMLDACIPPGAAVEVFSRADDDWRELTLVDWQPEPSPYLRGTGSELPYAPRETGVGRGTWELLFQRARGRYLSVRLVLRGDGRSTPRLRALRAWYPRFSYLDHYLPAVYREDAPSASFLERFLANTEGTFTAIEDRIAAAHVLLDVDSAPAEAVDWLGRWLGVALDPSWEDERRRLFIRHAIDFFAARGTMRGLELALRLALDECVDERIFARRQGATRGTAPVRIIERFRARRTPRALLGDVATAVPGPQRLDPAARWQPASGGADLHRRYREAFPDGDATRQFSLVAAGAPSEWAAFAERTLGFVPRAGQEERLRWQRFAQTRYESIAAVNAAHGTAWSAFDDMRLPDDEPTSSRLAADWRAFLGATTSRDRRRWQDFLARRYRNAAALRAAWRKGWSAFTDVALPDRVPADGAALTDWYQFEGTVLAMHRAAHRFTAMLPVPRHLRVDTPAQKRRLALAKAVLDLEKPAHTVYDVRFYWAMFRLGEARLGDDTLIDLGSRAPELMAPMVLGEGYLAEAFLAAGAGADAPARLQIGRDRVGRSARLGGP